MEGKTRGGKRKTLIVANNLLERDAFKIIAAKLALPG